MIKIKIVNWKKVFNSYIYKSLFDYSERFEVYYGGASSGKSHGVYQKVIMKAMNNNWKKPRKVLVLRKVGASIRESCWQHVKDILEEFKIIEYCKVHKSEFTITLPNGALLIFTGLDDVEKMKSIKGISDIVMEEATEFTLDDFTQLNLRLRDRKHHNKQMYLMFNPVSKKNWVFTYFFQPDGKPNPDSGAKLFWSTYRDNRFLGDDVGEELEKLRIRNPAYYRIYALGEFATLDKLIFPRYTKRLITAEDIKGLPGWQGLDFGYTNDPSALCWGYVDIPNRKVFIKGEYVKKGMTNPEIAQTIIDLALQKEKIYADAAEPKSIQEIKNAGVNIESASKGPDSLIHGIQWLLQFDIIVDERCFEVCEELENYTWKKDKKSGEYVNEPVDSYNHTIDAIRYGLNKFINALGGLKAVTGFSFR